MTKQTKLEARARMASILTAALRLAVTYGYNRITRDAIGTEARIAPTLITYHFGTMATLRRDIMREAIRVECLPVIAQGLAMRDKHAMRASDDLRHRALATLGG